VFFQLDERAEKILRMNESDALAVYITLRFYAPEYFCSPRGDRLGGFVDTAYLESEVVYTAARIAFEKLADRRIRAQRLHELDARITELDVSEAHALRLIHEHLAYREAVNVL